MRPDFIGYPLMFGLRWRYISYVMALGLYQIYPSCRDITYTYMCMCMYKIGNDSDESPKKEKNVCYFYFGVLEKE